MGLFSKEACVFCGTEVGMLKRSKLATKEFICNECKTKTNYFARMDYTSKDAAQGMMEGLAQEEADFEASFDNAENRFQSAERSFKTWDLGSLRVHYRCNTRLGAFQINLDAMSRYEHIPVFYFDTMIPYEFASENEVLADIRRNEVTNMNENYVTVEESKDAEGKVSSCTVVIPYNNNCIREIKLKGDVRNKEDVEVFYDFAQRINQDRINWVNAGLYDEERKNKMQVRNLGDTAAAALKAAMTGGSVEEAVKQGIETANDIEEGKVRQGFFGKLLRNNTRREYKSEKKLLSLILACVMVCSLTACDGDKPSEGTTSDSDNTITADSATSDDTKEEKTTTTDGAEKSEKSSVMVFYGWGSSSDEEKYTSEIFCPEGAEFDENTLENYEENGSVMTVQVDDEVNEYHATSKMHWHRDAYNNEPTAYPIIAQLYFDGELDAETAAENSNCSQTVTPLGFKWNDYDVILIETKYTFLDYGEQTELFVGVEYDLDYWKAEEGTGEIKDLTTKALFGFDMYSTGWDGLTQDKCAWIIGELFGVDSGVANPFAVSDEETTAPATNVEASELLGTWLERDSDWDNTYIFNADGTGVLISGPEYPFTYDVNGDVLTLTYDEEDVEEFTVSVSGDLLTMVDRFGNELFLDKKVAQNEEAEETEELEETVEAEPENPYVKEIVATWVDQESGYEETFTFNADGTGMYSFVDGDLYEYPITYNFLRSDYLQFFYEDGSEGGFIIRIEGDTLYVTNETVVDMPLVRQ